MEQRAAARSEWLATEDGLNFILSRLRSRRRLPVLERARNHGPMEFSFSEFVEIIRDRAAPSFYLPFSFIPRGLSQAAAEKLAKAHLNELETRGIVRKIPSKRVDLPYEMEIEATE
jgi:hypothetical protein